MSGKNIDVSQITSINISTSLGGVMYGNYGEVGSGLLASIKGGDDSKTAIQEATSAVSKCSDNLTTAITQMNSYVDSMAEAFRDMDKEISQTFNTSATDIGASSHNQTNERPNKFSGAF
ncbi:hypothetical protein JZO78_15040 [Enterococcus ureilyticus]|uniref:hypothetical protein n=1 Tax=Enterococcus ureilyticus TaxID=1131292 RepID=UPI001A91EE38|nr:hypothetical protein [Enterococcus ureilyticus]MBO0447646.1 hypothetical protein [Enterococcus ureilyticus]